MELIAVNKTRVESFAYPQKWIFISCGENGTNRLYNAIPIWRRCTPVIQRDFDSFVKSKPVSILSCRHTLWIYGLKNAPCHLWRQEVPVMSIQPRITSEVCWDPLRKCYVNARSGVPDTIRVDFRKQHNTKYFWDNAKDADVYIDIVNTKGQVKIREVEHYNSIVRCMYEKLKTSNLYTYLELWMSTDFWYFNNTTGYCGLVPTLSGLGTYPKIIIKAKLLLPRLAKEQMKFDPQQD